MKTNTTLFVGLFLCLILSFTTQIQAQNLNVEGNATATKFIGDGSMLTNIDKDTLNELQKLMLSGDTLILSKDTTNVDLSAFINNWTINDGRDVVFGFNNNAGGLEGSAFGILNDASAPQSNAFGYLNTAAGLESSAFGYLNSATGSQSNAFGYSNQAPAPKSSALGYDNDATQIESSALGYNNMAMAEKSSAFGYSNQATGLESSAFGYDNTATGLGSNAFGYLNEASSNFSSAFGYGTLSNVYGLMTVGRFNDTLVGSPNTWVTTDPVFVIGNGETIGTRSTAVTVLKNGNFGIGTTTPTEKLEVTGNVKATNFMGDGSMLTNIAIDDADADASNELQDLSLSGETLNLSEDATAVDLSAFINNWTVADGRNAAFGYNNIATEDSSSAFGYLNEATALQSSALGYFNIATGVRASGIGYRNNATGERSSAFGYSNDATALHSSAFGYNTISDVYGLMAVGRNNADPTGSTTTWVTTDPIFVIGNGESNSNRSTAVTVLKNGSVGIGTQTPDEKLEVSSDDAAVTRIGVTNTSTGNATLRAKTVHSDYGWYSTGADNSFRLFDFNANLDRMLVDSIGKVGIGTSSPTQKLHVEGEGLVNSTSSDPTFVIQNDIEKADLLLKRGAATGGIQLNASGGALGLTGSAGGTNLIQFRTYGASYFNGGNLGIGTQTPDVKLQITGGTNAFNSGGGYIINGEVDDLNLALDNNEIVARNNGAPSNLFIQNPGGNTILNGTSGNVGVGTDNPQTKLHIEGGSDTAPTSGGYIVTGDITGLNISIDNNEIMARNNGGTSDLSLQNEGGNTIIASGINGQNVGIGTTNPTEKLEVIGNVKATQFIGDGSMLTNIGGSQDLSLSGDTLKLTNDPTNVDLSAFVNNWTLNDGRDITFGYNNSVSGSSNSAVGHDNTASFLFSSAFGYGNEAVGDYCNTFGYNNFADIDFCSAVGSNNEAKAKWSSAFGYNNDALELWSSAFGHNNIASGSSSNAFGSSNNATGTNSNAFGYNNTASFLFSSAFGYSNQATAIESNVFGFRTISDVYGLTVVGRLNVDPVGSTTTWVATDPVFVIGNGENVSNRSTAVTVLKNGNVGIGTTSPSSKLEVEGTITVTSLEIADLGSDNLGLDGDVIPFNGTDNFDLGNNNINESWDQVVCNSLIELSDRTIKKDIRNLEYGLKELLQLRPVRYQHKTDLPNQRKRIGLIAQEVQQIIPELVKTHDVDRNAKGQLERKSVEVLGMNYTKLSVILINSIKEQQAQIEAKDDLIQAQNEKIESLEARLAKIEALLSGNVELNAINATITDASLQQNAPNPFSEATTINYFIPEQVKTANLQVMDQNGRIIKTIPIQATGKGQITLQANLLSAGTYSYSLVLDGQVIDTKQMVLTH